MKHYSCLLMLLSLCIPAMAEQSLPSCGIIEDNDASAPVQEHLPTAQVLERIRTDRTLTVSAATAQLFETAGDGVLDDVVGHLRWVIRNDHGDAERTAYWLLREMKVGGRADVADEFIAGLENEQAEVRSASASGLIIVPSSKRAAAGFALIDRLGKEGDESVYHAVLNALPLVVSPAHKSRVGALRAVLSQDRTSDARPGLIVDWKTEAATAIINILGPEEAIKLFGDLDPSKSGERFGIEGAAVALTMFGGENFTDMDSARRDVLRDLFRTYGVGLLAQDSREEAERDARTREAAMHLFMVVLGPPKKGWRDVDVSEIRTALQIAVSYEKEGSPVAGHITEFLEFLSHIEDDQARS